MMPSSGRPSSVRATGAFVGHIGAAAVLLSLLLLPSTAGAQVTDPMAGQVIESVEWVGLRSLSEETLEYYLDLREGELYDPEELNRRIHDLWDRSLIDDITIENEPGGAGLRLRVTVDERPVLRSIDYEGLKKLSRTDVTDRLDKERLRVREGMPLDRGELERLKTVLEEMYREKGYRFADVSYRTEEASVGEQRVIFSIDEGDKVKIQNIAFEGNEVFSDRRLRWAMKKTKESGLISRILKRDIYNPATVQEDLDKVRDLYRERGYKNVGVSRPEVEVRALRPEAPAKNQKRRLFLEIPVAEGERWKFGDISIEGNEVYPDELLLRTFEKPRGKSPWLRASAIDKGVEAVGEIYRNSGYIYSQVDVELQERGDDIADVIVHVHEGDQYRVGRLEFKGNDRTRDKVLRREFRVHEGRVLNMGALKSSLFKLNQLGYFKLDEENPIEFTNFDSEAKTVDLLVRGEESDRTELLFGGGWSELDGFFGQFSVRTQNFLGRGETLGVSIQAGGIRDVYELSYFVPWLKDRPQSAGFQLYSRELDYVLFGSDRQRSEQIGAQLSYGRSLGLFHSLRLSAGYESIENEYSFVNADGERVSQLFDYDKASLRPLWLFDSQDNRLEPTRGLRTLLSAEYAGGPLGGQIDLVKPELELTWYRPVSRGLVSTVFGTHLEAGLVENLGDEDLPVYELYYRGGPRSVRGFTTRSLYLRDEEGEPLRNEVGQILGGSSFLEFGLEYHFLLGGPFRLVFFGDAGNVFGDGQSFDPSDMRYSAGAELRLFVPMFGLPLRFIYATNLDPQPGDRFENFQFDIGTSF